MRRFLIPALILAAAAMATAAKADTFNYTYTGQAYDATANTYIDVSFDLTLTGSTQVGSSFGTAIFGLNEISSSDSTVNGEAVSFDDTAIMYTTNPIGLYAIGYDDDSNLNYDNLFYASSTPPEDMTPTPLDDEGLGFTAGGDFFQIYSYTTFNGTNYTAEYGVPVSATPEPSSLLLLGTGLAGIVSAIRRKAKSR
jgi:hypothetical protein